MVVPLLPSTFFFWQAYTVLKTTFTPAEVTALRDEALDKGFEAFNNVAQGASSSPTPPHLREAVAGDPSSSQPPLSRAGRRRRKAKAATNPSLSAYLDQAQSAAGATTAAPFVHPDPPPRKKIKTPTGSVVTAAVAAAAGDATADGAGSTAMEAEKVPDSPAGGEVRVEREYGVADKKGQRHQIVRPRTVSTSFGQASVDAYLTLVTSALSRKMDDLANGKAPNKGPDGASSFEEVAAEAAGSGTAVSAEASAEDAMVVGSNNGGGGGEGNRRAAGEGEVVGVISYTEELGKNVVRTGIPPPLPKYTKVAMWRGEDVCLDQLGAGDMKELMVGIAWCEPKGSRYSVDLDLSVMVRLSRLLFCFFAFRRNGLVKACRCTYWAPCSSTTVSNSPNAEADHL